MIDNLPELIAAGVAEASATIEARFAEKLEGLKDRLANAEKALLEERASHASNLENARQAARQEIEREIERQVEKAKIEIRASALSFPVPTDWIEGRTYYQGEAARHRGGTWIATRKTADEPGSNDWALLADGIQDITRGGDSVFVIRSSGEVSELADIKGEKGDGFAVRGLWNAEETYRKGDLILENGSRFVALSDDPGAFPGPGWELFVQRGSKGSKGEQGPRGEKGFDGEQGKSFLEEIAAWRDGKVFEAGVLVVHDGKLFVSNELTSSPPGSGNAWLRIREIGA